MRVTDEPLATMALQVGPQSIAPPVTEPAPRPIRNTVSGLDRTRRSPKEAVTFREAPIVTVQDIAGNTVTTNTSTVTVAIGTNPSPGSVLSGTSLARAAVGGLANFSANARKIDKAATSV